MIGEIMKRMVLLLTLVMCGWTLAQEPAHPPAGGDATHAPTAEHAVDRSPHPIVAKDSSWAGVVVIVVIAMFVAAAAVGIAVTLNAPQPKEADAHGHDEHAAHDEHGDAHGHGH